MKKISFLFLALSFLILGSNSGRAFNFGSALDAAMDGVRAATLTDEDVAAMSLQFAQYSDVTNKVAGPGSPYAKRLNRLTARLPKDQGRKFNYKVYLVPEVNAFALGDGSIRLYSGLMDLMDDDELIFVIGHEQGHVVNGDTKAAISRAYTLSAVRKGVASQGGRTGQIASSELGGLLETFIKAQYSQNQEKAADDFGFDLMQRQRFRPEASVTALRKLAGLGGSHSFLSSHPEPGARAKRLEDRLKR